MAVRVSHVIRWCACLAAGGAAVAITGLPATAVTAPVVTSTVRYRYVKIAAVGTNEFGTFNAAAAVNSAGEVVGSSSVREGFRAYSWLNGHLTDLGVLARGAGPFESSAAGLNDLGDVVGATQINGPSETGPHAFITRHGTTRMVDLGTGYPGVGSGSAATALNDSGQVVGYHYPTQSAQIRAVTWRGGKLTELPGLGGHAGLYGTDSKANAINTAGQIVGVAQPRDTRQALHGVLWGRGVPTDLGNLGGTGEATSADGLNDHATVVGASYTRTRQLHAFSWKAGVMRDIGGPGTDPSGQTSEAYAVNNTDTAVGYVQVAAGPRNGWQAGVPAATVWRNGLPTDLNRLVTNLPKGTHLSFARAINDNGVIVGATCPVSDCSTSNDTFALIPTS